MKQSFVKKNRIVAFLLALSFAVLPASGLVTDSLAVPTTPPDPVQYESNPAFLSAAVPPLVMLVMGRNHKLYYEAYNDASDLNEDGVLDITYKPDQIDYYGYFDSFKYYRYNSSASPKRFDPVGTTTDKTAPSGDYWSGDFLNYLTMSRMDAMRKVLYGGYRSTDGDSSGITVLERAYIPQDAHSWGKEYESVSRDGYDISDYTPLSLPVVGTRHLFASTSHYDPSDSNYAPLLRVAPDNSYRIWNWVAKERPVCDDSVASSGGTFTSHPANHPDFENMITQFANASHQQGSGAATQINGTGNPHGPDDYYLTVFEGELTITTAGSYQFGVDGDDAVEVIVDGTVVSGFYGGHGSNGYQTNPGTISLTAGSHTVEFRHEEMSGGDSYYLYWNGPDSSNVWEIVPPAAYATLTQSTYDLSIPASTIGNYEVRVKVADSSVGLEDNNKQYPDGNYKPIGILQRYGENEKMYFGLLTGSYTKNTSGGVLRKAVGDINDEIVAATGQFTSLNGIIRTIDMLRIVDFRYSGNYDYNSNCGWITTRPINEGECRMWGNPVGEMMYETLRYFSGAGSPTSDFTYSHTNDNDAGTDLALPKPSWSDPYDTSAGGYEHCAKPFMLVLSDINPTYDSDQLPGSYFGSMSATVVGDSGNPSMDVEDISDTIFTHELSSGNRYIGQQAANYDGACTAKTVDSFGNIRGLCPEEPTKEGSYYAAAVSAYGWANDIHDTATGTQKVRTYAVGLASPLPKIEIPLKGKTITVVPFAKSVGNWSIVIDPTDPNYFTPTNTIVDFFVEEITDVYGRFRINFEDVEQGADHDMDAIVQYEYQLIDAFGIPVTDPALADALTITLTSEYAAGSIDQHMGYIISGTTADGAYLEVKDVGGGHREFFLDYPNDPADLPLTSAPHRFEVDTSSTAASLLTNPLWYAAKWGAFEDQNSNNIPDLTDEWDKDGDGSPDTYYYVVNPLKLEEQLNKSFAAIGNQAAAGTTASVLATNSEGDGHLVQAYFKPEVNLASGDKITWLGYMQSLWVDPFGNMREDSDGDHRLDLFNSSSTSSAGSNVDRIISFYYDTGEGKTMAKVYNNHHHYNPDNGLNADCRLSSCPDLDNASNWDRKSLEEVIPLFEAGEKLQDRDADTRTVFTSIGGTTTDFTTTNLSTIKPYLGLRDDTEWTYLDADPTSPDQNSRATNLIEYIRGKDSADLSGTPDTRSRTMDGKVWKLGDIVNSTPTSISRPPDNFHIIYGDSSFQTYYDANRDRETVVYVGANDGMLHAFTAGVNRGTYFDTPSGSYDFGDELWAYIPGALLPHLKFLANPAYGHTYYVDLKPKIFDARIGGTSGDEWRTIMLVGLNLGGKEIGVEDDFGSGVETRYFSPTLSCLDITDPRNPVLMWEKSYANLAMTTSFPGVVKVGGERTVSGGRYTWNAGKWFAVVGSGPTDYDGTSGQNGHIFIIDLKTGNLAQSYDTGQANALMNSPVSYDKDLTFNVDGIYFGSMAGPVSSQTGKVFKVNTRTDASAGPDEDPATWTLSSMFDSPTPISGSISLGKDGKDNVWAFFGTGRYGENNVFKADDSQQYLFGVKDPYFNPDQSSYYKNNSATLELDTADLFNASPVQVYDDLTVTGAGSTVSNWGDLIDEARTYDGWYQALERTAGVPSERVISKPTLLGGIVFFPAYTPDEDVCSFGGETAFYGLYYETGTAYYQHIFSTDTTTKVGEKLDMGAGAPPPTAGFHIGREKGATAFLQKSSGEVEKITVETAFPIKSGVSGWRDLD